MITIGSAQFLISDTDIIQFNGKDINCYFVINNCVNDIDNAENT